MKTAQVPEKGKKKKPQNNKTNKKTNRPVSVLQFVLVAEKVPYGFIPSSLPPNNHRKITYSPFFPITSKAETTGQVE